jgi:hypothetical protein
MKIPFIQALSNIAFKRRDQNAILVDAMPETSCTLNGNDEQNMALTILLTMCRYRAGQRFN